MKFQGKETIEDCIGRNAGPCLDHDRLGHIIVDMYMKSKSSVESTTEDDLYIAKQKVLYAIKFNFCILTSDFLSWKTVHCL